VKTVMSKMGRALMGTGVAKGQNRARLAAEMAVASPLLDDISVEGATGVLINVVGGPDLKMKEIQEAASLVQEQAHEDANIIFGASIDETLGENVKVTVIATGFDAIEQEFALQASQQSQRMSTPPQTVQSAQPRSSAYGAPRERPSQTEIPAISTRRVQHAHEARTQASSQPRLPIRERLGETFTAALDNDWDVPAFQRKRM
jgi:cell division protein FtsZ